MSELHSVDHERGVLGALLLGSDGGPALAGLLADEGLRPEHFWLPKHRLIFEAMVGLQRDGEPVEAGMVLARLGGQVDPNVVRALPVEAAGSFRAYARVLIDLERRRTFVEAARTITEGALSGDRERVAEGERLLAQPERGKRVSRESRQQAVMEIVEGGGLKGWRWPFSELNDLMGGAYRGQFTILLGHEKHGKTILMRQVLDSFHRQGAKAALYTNEMTPEEIDLRFVARESGVPYLRLVKGKVRDGEHASIVRAVEAIGQGIEVIPAEGWTADEVAHDVKRHGWDCVGLDLLNGVAGGTEVRDLDQNMKVLAHCTRQVGCHLLASQHLNSHRMVGRDYPPEPVLSDVRGTAAIRQLANNVMAVHRFEEEIGGEKTGSPGEDAVVKLLAVRGGVTGRVAARFDGARMRFLPKTPEAPTVAVA